MLLTFFRALQQTPIHTQAEAGHYAASSQKRSEQQEKGLLFFFFIDPAIMVQE